MDDLRSSYKAFLESPGGKDLLAWLLNREVVAQMEGRKGKTVEEKALAMVQLNDAYEVRTHLDEMSKPSKAGGLRSSSLT